MKVGDKVKIINKDYPSYGTIGTVVDTAYQTVTGIYIRIEEDNGTFSCWYENSLEVIEEYYIKVISSELLRLHKTGIVGWYAEKYKDGTITLGISINYTITEDIVRALQMLVDTKFPEVVYHTTIETKEPVHTLWLAKDLINNMGYVFVEKNKKVNK